VAEYHNTLREQNRLPGADQRSLAAATDTSRDTEASSAITSTTTAATVATTATATTASTRRWIPARPKTSDCNAKPPRKYSGKRDNSSSSSNILSPPLQQLSREEIEEFETLPLAVRRKVSLLFQISPCLDFFLFLPFLQVHVARVEQICGHMHFIPATTRDANFGVSQYSVHQMSSMQQKVSTIAGPNCAHLSLFFFF
jgi:hypothetical protein